MTTRDDTAHITDPGRETFQIPLAIAEAYERRFVPSIFAEWAPHTLDAAGATHGSRLLDVACGTGIVARTGAERVGPGGVVVGVDLNEAMLTVARRIAPEIDWRQGDVDDLPVEDAAFDAVTCQMAMMFFPDRAAAFRQMRRALAPAGRIGVVVPTGLNTQPAYRVFVDVAVRHAGSGAASLLGTYWSCGDLDELGRQAEDAGLRIVETRTRTGTATFASCDEFVATEIDASPLAERIDTDVRERIMRDTRAALARYTTGQGDFAVPLLCHVVSAAPSPPA